MACHCLLHAVQFKVTAFALDCGTLQGHPRHVGSFEGVSFVGVVLTTSISILLLSCFDDGEFSIDLEVRLRGAVIFDGLGTFVLGAFVLMSKV